MKYRMVRSRTSDHGLFSSVPVYALVRGKYETVIDGVYRTRSLTKLVDSIIKVPSSKWETRCFSVVNPVEEVYMEAWTKKGIVQKAAEEYPELLI